MLTNDEYQYFKNLLLERRPKAYLISNEALANEYYNELVKEYPGARIYKGSGFQYICLGAEERKELVKELADLRAKREAEIRSMGDLIAEIQKGA